MYEHMTTEVSDLLHLNRLTLNKQLMQCKSFLTYVRVRKKEWERESKQDTLLWNLRFWICDEGYEDCGGDRNNSE